MCWRERILTLRSSLITYTAKEFVYVIIFRLTASPRAAGSRRCGHEEGALLLLLPHTKPSSAPRPWYKLCAGNTCTSPASPWPGLSPTVRGEQAPPAPHTLWDVSCSISEG